MTERAFVLVPLAEIAPDWVHPVTKSAIRPTPANSRLFRSAKIATVKIEQNSPIVPVKKKCNPR